MRQRLQRACDDATIVRLHRRRLEEGHEDGYVAAVGEQLVMIARIAEEIWLDGFSVLRMRDLSDVETPAPHREPERSAPPRIRPTEVSLWNLSTVLIAG
jgi:hypothetical protein